MIRVAVSGASGRMGGLVCAAVDAADDLELVVAHDPAGVGADICRIVVTDDPGAIATADVVVEFTRPDVVMENLASWRSQGVHAVVGTSGFDAARLEELRTTWGEGPPNCLVVPNFSIGAVMMMRLAEIAAPHFAAAEVIELHHDRKADAPSGTAIATAGRIAAAAPDQRRAVESAELIPGARGADAGGIPVHGVRLPGLVAHQEVLFGNEGETLRVRHDTTDRVSFMPGVLLAVRSIADQSEPLAVGLEGLLGI
jgi:4-hydroxy-tetrahydrodipicolinate reductase